jgi:DnaD/phage-associated family protein
MKDFYFSHDKGAMIDEKILVMRATYGMEGYGCFWAVVEMLSKKDNLQLPLKAETFSALTLLCQPTLKIEDFINDCIGIGLFESDGDSFWSNSLRRRVNETQGRENARIAKAEKAAAARWSKKSNAQASRPSEPTMQEQCSSNAQAMPNDANKIKEKEIETKTEDTHACEEAAAPATRYLEENLMSLSSRNWEDLRQLYEDGITDELVKYAVDEACAQGKRTWGYVRSILNKCVCEGITTLQQVRDREKRRQAEVAQRSKAQEPRSQPTLKPIG